MERGPLAVPLVDPRPLVGREHDLGALLGVVGRAAGGAGQVVLVEGEAGIGKTRLVAEALAGAVERGGQTFYGAADELERERPFAVLAEALALVPGAPDPARAEIARLLFGETAPAALGGQVVDAAFQVIEAILALLEELAARSPVVLALDDLHWADPATLRAIRSMALRLGHVPVVLLAALRTAPRRPELDHLVDTLLVRGARHILLQPVDEEATATLAAQVAGGVPGPRLRRQLAGAGGNPLYVIELVRALADDCALEVRDGVADAPRASLPPTLRLTVLRRLSVLPAATIEMLKVASVLGTSFSLSELSALTGESAVALLPALDRALSARLLQGSGEHLAFRHPLVREAIYEDLPLAVRKAIHLEAGRALAAAGAPAGRVAPHFSLGAPAGDAEALRWMRQAAREVAPHSPALAVELLQRAVAVAGPGEGHGVVAELAPLLVQTGRGPDAEALLTEALARGPSAPVEAALWRGLGEVLWVKGHYEAALAALERAVGMPGVTEAERAAPRALGANARFFLVQVERARDEAEQARAEAGRAGDDFAAGLALQTLALVADAQGFAGLALDLAHEALRRARRSRHPLVGYLYPHLYLGLILLEADRFDDAETALQEGRRLAEERGTVVWLPLYHWVLSMLRYMTGAWDDAVTEVQTGLALAEEVGTRLWAPLLHGTLAVIALHRGHLEAARARMDDADCEMAAASSADWVTRVRGEGGLPGAGLHWPAEVGVYVNSLIAEAMGDAALALSSLRMAWDLSRPLRYFYVYRWFGPDLVRLALQGEDRALAVSVTAEVEEGARRSGVLSAEAAALRCRGLVEDDPDTLVAAAAASRRTPRALDTAYALEEAGGALQRAGREAEAVAALEEALDLYGRFGATRRVARVEAALRDLGVRHRRRGRARRAVAGWESLTETELCVVGLAAEGLTNRQIGERLFISRRTAETHLSNVFRKLGIATRAQLAAEAARRPG